MFKKLIRFLKFREIRKLHRMLKKRNIDHIFTEAYGGYQILIIKENGDLMCSMIEHQFSYGNKFDLIEAAGLTDNGIRGFLTAKETYRMIERKRKRCETK